MFLNRILPLAAFVLLAAGIAGEAVAQNPLGQRVNWIGTVNVEELWNESGGSGNGVNWQDYAFGNNQPSGLAPTPEYASISTSGGTGRAVINAAIGPQPTDIIIGQDSNTAGSLIVRDGGSITVQSNGGFGNGELIVGASGIGNLGLEDDMGSVSVAKYTQGNSGLLVARLSGAGTFAQHVQSSGGISLDGRLIVERLVGSDFTLTTGNSWTVISGSPVTGNFDTIEVAPELLNSPGQTLAVSTTGNAVTLSVSQRLVLNVDSYSGAATLVNEAGHSVSIDLVEYTMATTTGTMTSSNGRWKSFADDPSKPNWFEAGVTTTSLSEVNGGARLVAASGFTHDFGTPFDVNASAPKGTSRVNLSGVSFLYADPDTGTQTSAAINIMGARNDMALVINPDTGNATIQNQFGEAIDFISYTIHSASGALLPNSFSGVEGGNGPDWFDANWTVNDLSEAIGTAATQSLGFLDSLDLGVAWDAAEGARDLTFRYQDPTTGQLISGLVYYGDVVEAAAGIGGDYNGDGMVNLADYTVWRDNLGSDGSAFADGTRNPSNTGPVSAADYNFWKSNFGASSFSALQSSPAAVPEPATCLMLAISGLAIVVARHTLRRTNTI